MFPAVNIGCGWCSRTYEYVSTHMPPTRSRRSTRMTFCSRDRYRLATNRALSPARPAPTMQTSQLSTATSHGVTAEGWGPVIVATVRRSAAYVGAGAYCLVAGAARRRVRDYTTSSLLLASKATSKPSRCMKRGANRVSPAPRSRLPGVEAHDVLDGQPLGRTEVSALRVLGCVVLH